MLNSWIISISVAASLGFLSGIGTGGGSLLILWLTLVLGFPPNEARLINLMFFIPSALVACLFHMKQGKLEIRKLIPSILAGCACAFLVSIYTTQLSETILQKLFGALLILTGIRELCYKPKAGQ